MLLNTSSKLSKMTDAYVANSQETKIWKDKHERTHAELVVTQIDLSLAKKVEADLLDSLRKVTGIKPKHTRSVVTVHTRTTDTVAFYLNKPRWSNKWASFEWLDSSRLAYSVVDSMILVNHIKRHGFLNLKSTYVTRVVTFNPNTTTLGMKSIEFVPPKRRISIGAHAGYGLQFSGGGASAGWNIGIGLNYKFF
jgi:hypothetical protein